MLYISILLVIILMGLEYLIEHLMPIFKSKFLFSWIHYFRLIFIVYSFVMMEFIVSQFMKTLSKRFSV